MTHRLLKFLPWIILVTGVGVFVALASSRKAPERRSTPDRGPLVETVEAPARTQRIVVQAQGSVRPAEEIDVVPQVSGVVVWTAPELEAGGYFARGEVLLRVDPRDYELAVTAAEAAVARTRYALDLAREEAAVARQEWALVAADSAGGEPGDLVLKLPQVRAAEAELMAAQATLDAARLRLERTELRAPFDGRVRSTSLDVGQYVVANQPVARVYSIERAEIVVAVPDQDMAWLRVPRLLPGTPLSGLAPAPAMAPAAGPEARPAPAALRAHPEARVHADFAGRRHEWIGFVARTAAELDPRSRMLSLVVQVDAPYGDGADGGTPLLVGMFVDVDIVGEMVDDVRLLPRVALHEDDAVWVADADGRLRVRRAEVVHVHGEDVLVRLPLAAGEQVVVTRLSGATDGMKIRVQARQAGGEERAS